MTIPNRGYAMSAGDMVLCTEHGNVQVTTTGMTNRKTIHLTLSRKNQPPLTVALNQKQARMFVQHIIHQL
ncbi:hypothetical protein [Corynebacterium dentalis]|uniref:hypothetical protein n=1 Tax=Corynebacterium dentalis TaxID=2014528 RepID=UPI00289D905E|nr:hypothetical protein [Corynebacterium dentalis]